MSLWAAICFAVGAVALGQWVITRRRPPAPPADITFAHGFDRPIGTPRVDQPQTADRTVVDAPRTARHTARLGAVVNVAPSVATPRESWLAPLRNRHLVGATRRPRRARE
jgi:hypothetical protein